MSKMKQKKFSVVVDDCGDGTINVTKENLGFNKLELAGLFTFLLEELKQEVLNSRAKAKKIKEAK